MTPTHRFRPHIWHQHFESDESLNRFVLRPSALKPNPKAKRQRIPIRMHPVWDAAAFYAAFEDEVEPIG